MRRSPVKKLPGDLLIRRSQVFPDWKRGRQLFYTHTHTHTHTHVMGKKAKTGKGKQWRQQQASMMMDDEYDESCCAVFRIIA